MISHIKQKKSAGHATGYCPFTRQIAVLMAVTCFAGLACQTALANPWSPQQPGGGSGAIVSSGESVESGSKADAESGEETAVSSVSEAATGEAEDTGLSVTVANGSISEAQAETSSTEEANLLSELAEREEELEVPDAEEVRNLSVEPGAHTLSLLPADRPAWVGAPPDYSGEVHRLYVESIPVANRDRVDESLDERLVAAVCEYVEQEILKGAGNADELGITSQYIRRNLINEPEGYVAEIATSDGPMYQKWVALEITPTQRAQLTEWHLEAVQRQRMVQVAVALVAVFGFVGVLHLLMRSRHAPATSMPLNVDPKTEPPTVPSAKPNSGISFLAAMLGVLLLPAMLFAALAVPFVLIDNSSQTEPPTPNVSSPEDRMHSSRIEVRQADSHHEHGLHKSGKVMKIESGNQEVIIIRKP